MSKVAPVDRNQGDGRNLAGGMRAMTVRDEKGSPTGDRSGRGCGGREERALRLGSALTRRQEYAGVVAGGVLYALSFAPLDLGFPVLVALVPLASAWRRVGPARGAWLGFVAGCAAFLPLLWWSSRFGMLAWVAWSAASAASWATAGAAVGWARRLGLRGPWVVPTVWALVEMGRERWPFGGSPWGEVGSALHDYGAARSLAAVVGISGLGFLVVAVNVLLAAAWARRSRALGKRRRAGWSDAFVVGVLVLVGSVTVAGPRLVETGSLRVAMIQGNDQNRDLTVDEVEARFLERRHLQMAGSIDGPVDLVVFPESAFDVDPRADGELAGALGRLARRLDAPLVVNAAVPVPGREDDDVLYNTNFLVRADGTVSPSAYEKVKVVPFGEYVPLRSLLEPLVPALDQIPRDFLRGDGRVQFDVQGHAVGTLICFEVGFPTITRNYAREGAELLVVTTNNRSFGRSPNARQQLATAQMRAAESGRYLLQAGISGITAVIDQHGRVVQQTDLFERTVVETTVPTLQGRTAYVRFGDWLPLGSAVLLGAAELGRRLRRPLSED